MNSNIFKLDLIQNKLNKKETEYIDQLIEGYLTKGSKNLNPLKEIMKKYSKKSDIILSACTELSILLDEINISFVDTMDILVESTIKKWKDLELN